MDGSRHSSVGSRQQGLQHRFDLLAGEISGRDGSRRAVNDTDPLTLADGRIDPGYVLHFRGFTGDSEDTPER